MTNTDDTREGYVCLAIQHNGDGRACAWATARSKKAALDAVERLWNAPKNEDWRLSGKGWLKIEWMLEAKGA